MKNRGSFFFKFTYFLFFFSIFLLFDSCKMEENPNGRYFVFQSEESSEKDLADAENEQNQIAKWTFLVYMAADNELERAAISDINEMENIELTSDVNLLVLIDRAFENDSSNDDWTGTRLYKISKDEDSNKNLISSERLSCPDLELFADCETELDMGNKNSLTGFLQFSRREFPSENLGLIIWGHGSGWRGFSEDETNSSSLSLPDLRSGIEAGSDGEKLDFLGFDTCFASTLEVAFELKDCAEIMAGTPGISNENGWNYDLLFSDFISSDMSLENLAKSCRNQFEKTYIDYQYGAFSVLKLSEIENLVSVFNDFAEKSALKITDDALRRKIFSAVEKQSVSYFASTTPTDFYVDILSLEKNICDVLQDDEISLAGKNLEDALNLSVLEYWNVFEASSVAVYFGYYKSEGIFSFSHPENYVNGSRNSNLCKFVSKCVSYVPSKNKNGSLLDKLFYMDF